MLYKNILRSIFIMSVLLTNGSASISNDYLILAGNANPKLAKKVGEILDKEVNTKSVGKFNNGEIRVEYDVNIRNHDVFIIQSTCKSETNSVNDNLMELYLMIRAAKRASAKSINVVIPHYGYARQDRRSLRRAPISGAEVAMLIENAGANRVITIDLHCGQIEGFFQHISVDNLAASRLFAKHVKAMNLKSLVLVSPDAGGVPRVKKFQDILGKMGIKSDIAIVIKERKEAGKVGNMTLVGNVKGKNAIILDDMVDTAGTLAKAAKKIKDCGAKTVYAFATHPVLSKNAMANIENSVLKKVIVTNSIPITTKGTSQKIEVIGLEEMIAKAITHIKDGRSISRSF